MKNSTHFEIKGFLAATFSFLIFYTWGNLMQTSTGAEATDLWTTSNSLQGEQNFSKTLDCGHIVLMFESDEFEILPNKSALVYGKSFSPDEYNLKGNELIICLPDDNIEKDASPGVMTVLYVIHYISIVGPSISVISLTIHLIIFCSVPALRNLPGCNLASLSISFLLGFSFSLLGQILRNSGLSCVISGVLQLNFMLTSFFCMNVLSFDVWRTLRLSTQKLRMASQSNGIKRFVCYSLYSWGCPLVISTISVILDNTDAIPDHTKPNYGADGNCWITNDTATIIFMTAPAFVLLAINGIFFLLCRRMISGNTMKRTNDQEDDIDKSNYTLYMRLGVMMGLSWLLSFVSTLFIGWLPMWFTVVLVTTGLIFTSLQGLFLLLLSTCTKKVLKHIKRKPRTPFN